MQILKQLCYNSLEDAIVLASFLKENQQTFSEDQKADILEILNSFKTILESSKIIQV